MTSCTIEKLAWTIALVMLFSAVYAGNLRNAGMVFAVAAAVWYGVICPFAEEIQAANFKSKGSVN